LGSSCPHFEPFAASHGGEIISWRWPILAAWCGFLFFYGLSGPLYRTEALRAIIGQSALDGHWLTPTLYGEPFLTKPPGVYAAIGLASLPAGRVTEITARIPSGVAATLTILFGFATLRRFLGEPRAFAAAMVMPMSVLWLDKAPSAEIDILQLAWVSAALFSFLRAYEAKESSRSGVAVGWWIAALLCVTGGFLTKWTAPAFFYLAVGPFLVWRGRARWLFARDHLLAVLVFVGLCAAWASLVSAEVGWSTLSETVRQEAEQRFAPKANGRPYPWLESLTFPAIVLGASLPWSIPALFALRLGFLRRIEEPERTLVQLLHCWAWPNLLFWALPSQHHIRYVLPIAPAITLLGVVVLSHWMASVGSVRRLVSPRAGLIAAVLAWAVVKGVFVEAAVPQRTAGRGARETGEQLARLVPPGEILYLCRLKDEGVLFYYGRPGRRLAEIAPPADRAIHVLMLDAEWDGGHYRGQPEYIAELRDQQGAPIHLVRLHGPEDVQWPPVRTLPTSSPSAP
jgi:4-amino-4-deoxy-L-arabinose transferase-like glycosyltransferase